MPTYLCVGGRLTLTILRRYAVKNNTRYFRNSK